MNKEPEPRLVPTDRKTARQIKDYLAQEKEQRRRWIQRQKTDPRNQTWKRDFGLAAYAQHQRSIRDSGGSLRPADGTVFYAPTRRVDEARAQAMEKTILEHVAERTEPPGEGTTLAYYAAEAVSSRAAEHLTDLELLASRGDAKALEAFARIARAMVGTLNRLAKPRKMRLRRLASRCLNWPVLMGRNSMSSDDHKSVLKDLGVGTNLPFSSAAICGLKGKPHKRVLKLAMELACRLEDWRTREPDAIVWFHAISPPTRAEQSAPQLRAFSKTTWPAWFGAAWEIVLEENSGHPEVNSELRPIGLYREKHSLLEAQQKRSTRKTSESNIKDGIKEKLKQGFEQMAKQAT
jgi:hypothetical protein